MLCIVALSALKRSCKTAFLLLLGAVWLGVTAIAAPLAWGQANLAQGFLEGSDARFRRYRLGPGDEIYLEVQGFPDLSLVTVVNPEGKIIVRLLGAVELQGFTLEEAQAAVQLALSEFIIDPVVSLELLVQRPVEVTVSGEVARPGSYLISPPNPASAVLVAGGATSAADLRSVRVRRFLIDGTAIEERIDLLTPLQTGRTFPDLRLEDGDVVILPRLEAEGTEAYDYDLVANSFLAAQTPIQINVVGEVAIPGFYVLPASPLPLVDALRVAGGITTTSNLQEVRVRRPLDNGAFEEYTFDLFTPLQAGGRLPDFRLANGDTVFVPELEPTEALNYDYELVARSFLSPQTPVRVTIAGEVARPGFYTLAPSPTPLADALLNAGGVLTSANLREIQVRRTLADGVTTQQTIDLFTPLVNGEDLPDFRLADGDVLFVPELAAEDYAEYDPLAVSRSTIAKPDITIRLLNYPAGRAGTQRLPNGSTFAEILNSVPIAEANLSNIALVRFDPAQGRAITQQIDGRQALVGNPAHDVPLRENDVIIVGRNFISRVTTALGSLTQPFRDILGFLLFFDSLQESAEDLFGPSSEDTGSSSDEN